MLVFFLTYGISLSDLSFLLLHLSIQFLYNHATTLVIQIVPNIFTFFLPMIFYVCCNFTKLFFRIFYVCSMFFYLISFHCYKGNQKMKSATAWVDCYTNVDKRIVEDELVQKPTHMIFFIFTFFFCISNDWFILFNLFPLLYLLTAIFHNQVIITKVSWSYCCTGFKTEGTCQKYWVPSSTGLGMQ